MKEEEQQALQQNVKVAVIASLRTVFGQWFDEGLISKSIDQAFEGVKIPVQEVTYENGTANDIQEMRTDVPEIDGQNLDKENVAQVLVTEEKKQVDIKEDEVKAVDVKVTETQDQAVTHVNDVKEEKLEEEKSSSKKRKKEDEETSDNSKKSKKERSSKSKDKKDKDKDKEKKKKERKKK